MQRNDFFLFWPLDHSFNSMISSYGNLIGVIRKVHPAIKIVISAIIPRPKDHKTLIREFVMLILILIK